FSSADCGPLVRCLHEYQDQTVRMVAVTGARGHAHRIHLDAVHLGGHERIEHTGVTGACPVHVDHRIARVVQAAGSPQPDLRAATVGVADTQAGHIAGQHV